ncbi:MAG: hypothetical protein QOJ64_650 [Acidobacteriota bacterium]|jgi:hypothetical protein|nr:hypothetical protein [Acidobacteriota bacterium]
MADPSFKQYLSTLKSLVGLLASVGVLVPLLSYFLTYSPPLLEESSLLTAGIAIAVIVITYYYKPPRNAGSGRLPPLVRLATKVLITSCALLILYIVLLQLCTVRDPPGRYRYQIGFSNYEWTLTDYGRGLMKENPEFTVRDLMNFDALYYERGPELTWKPWTIYFSGVLMIATFLLSFVLWTFGWALLAKQKSSSDR